MHVGAVGAGHRALRLVRGHDVPPRGVQPLGDLDVEDWTVTPEMIRAWEGMFAEQGEVRLLMAAEDSRSGELAGYTEVYWHPERAALVRIAQVGSAASTPLSSLPHRTWPGRAEYLSPGGSMVEMSQEMYACVFAFAFATD